MSQQVIKRSDYNGIEDREAVRSLLWQPNQDTVVALLSYILVVAGLYTAFQIFTTARTAANFITFGPVTLALAGIGVPVFYTVVIRRRSLATLGLTTSQLLPSLALGVILAWDTYSHTVATLDITWNRALAPMLSMVLAVGLFEALFFRGWLQLRFEEAFGLLPGLILGALCYSLYHIGYGMNSGELLFLFGLGLTFGAFFRLTRSIFVLWPFYTPMGSLYTNLNEGLALPFEATYGFVITLIFMAAILFIGARIARRRSPA